MKVRNKLLSNYLLLFSVLSFHVFPIDFKTFETIFDSYKEEPIEEVVEIEGKYQQMRYYDSDVYTYITGTNEKLTISKGTPKLEKLSELSVPSEIAKINLGMFDSTFEHGGMYLLNGEYIQPPMARYINLHYYKDGRMDIKNYGNSVDDTTLSSLKEETIFVVGTTYSLVQDGKKNLENAEVFTHSKERHPRSIMGQMSDGRYILVVVDGRTKKSRGVTAEQSADILLDLGAVEAVNLDGGGSSTFIVGHELKNHPSDKRERKIGSALFVIK